MPLFLRQLAIVLFLIHGGPIGWANSDCKEKLSQLFENSGVENKEFWDDWSAPSKGSTKFPRRLIETETPPARGSKDEVSKLKDFLAQPLESPEVIPQSASQKLLQEASQLLPSDVNRAFSDWLLGQFSEDAIVNFEDHFLGRQRFAYPEGPTRYQKNGERPFDGYIAARKALSGMKLDEMDLSQIKQLHRILMSRESAREDSGKIFQTDRTPARNSGALKDSELGEIRNQPVGFEVAGQHLPEGYSPISKTVNRLLQINPYLDKTRDGFLAYAPLAKWRSFDNRKPLSTDLIRKIQKIETEKGHEALKNKIDPEVQEAQHDFLVELTHRAWENAKRDIQSATTQGELMDAVGKFQRDFVSIHPFFDGNGRMARLLTEKLLEERGLPPPLYTHWGEDLTLTRKEHSDYLGRAVMLSKEFHNQLSNNLKSGKTHETILNPALSFRAQELSGDPSVPFDSTAFLSWIENHREDFSSFQDAASQFLKETAPPKESLTLKQMKTAEKVLGDSFNHFSPDEFFLWRKEQTDLPKSLKLQLDLYRKFLSDHIYDDKSGAIRLASPEFQDSFGKISASREQFEKKLGSFYSQQRVFRGVPTNQYLSDGELAQLFAIPTPMAMGNGVPYRNTAETVPPVFQQFNSELLRGGKFLRQQIIHHKDGTDEGYFMSGMVSFSEKEGVGRTWQHHMGAPMGLLFTANKRNVGVINTAKYNNRFERLGMPGEYEDALIGGTDPESIQEIELHHRTRANDQVVRRKKVARRTDYNTIEITETVMTPNSGVHTLPSTWWQIQPDGSLKQLPNSPIASR